MPATPITPAQIDEVGKGASSETTGLSPIGHAPTGHEPAAVDPSRGPAAKDWRAVMRNLLNEHDKNVCMHEETHRGGFLWTICDQCGRKWADDEGGFQAYEEPAAVSEAWAILKEVEAPVQWGDPKTVAGLIAQLRTLPPDAPIYGTFHGPDFPGDGRHRTGVRGVTLSREYVKGRWMSRDPDAELQHVIWTKPAQSEEAVAPAFAAANPSGKDLIDEAAALLGVARGIIKWGGNQRERRENAIKIADWLTAYRSAAASCDEHPQGEDQQGAEPRSDASAVGEAETPEVTPSIPPSPRKGQEENPCPMTVEEARELIGGLDRRRTAEGHMKALRRASMGMLLVENADRLLAKADRIELALSTIRASEEDR